MADTRASFKALAEEFKTWEVQGEVAELLIDEPNETIQVRWVGARPGAVTRRYGHPGVIEKRPNSQAYYFLSQPQQQPPPELRPGSGVIRVSGGKSEGRGGTLTCFLSSKDGRDNYFAAAGHVLSNFWNDDDVKGTRRAEGPAASIYRYQKGFPATNSTRFLGKLTHISDPLLPINRGPAARYEKPGGPVNMDIGIVKIRGKFEPVQRTTCYGSFGEWPKNEPGEIQKGLPVMKCGAEEKHWTYAVVEEPCTPVTVYGPGGLIYKLADQVILELEHEALPENTDPPDGWSARRHRDSQSAFAIPGDSGTMVVERESRRPVGMLIAGSVLDGRYVMTPFRTIQNFWLKHDLVLRRG